MYNPTYSNHFQSPTYSPQYLFSQGQQVTSSNVVWVQGENAAKSYPVAPGNSVLLMDSEESVMYIKSTDQSGMPQPLRIFDYTERTVQAPTSAVAKSPNVDYVSRKEFDEFKEEIKEEVKKNMRGVRSPAVQTVTKVGDSDA